MTKPKRATSKDVAEAAGVSRAPTVSFVLNAVPNVQIPEETRQRVWEAARRLGYYPTRRRAACAPAQRQRRGFAMQERRPGLR